MNEITLNATSELQEIDIRAALKALSKNDKKAQLDEYIFCLECGTKIKKSDRFCINCGTENIYSKE